MAFAPESGPKLLSWICLVLCLALVYNFTKEKIGGPAGSTLVYSLHQSSHIPGIVHGIHRHSGGALSAPAICALWRYSTSGKKALLVLSAFFIGIAAGKTNGLFLPSGIFYSMRRWFCFSSQTRGIKLINPLWPSGCSFQFSPRLACA